MTGCFSGRVDDYVKTRPSYPHALLAVLQDAVVIIGRPR